MHTPTMSDALPITPEQIASQSIAAARAGAAVIHLHARNPVNGEPTGSPEVFSKFQCCATLCFHSCTSRWKFQNG
jgi:uncharacterized protein (DUF849 family)